MSATTKKGTVKKIVGEKGFGFLKVADGGPDVFFHHSACSGEFDDLQEGQEVEFEIDDNKGGKGPRAANVRAA